MTKINWVMRSWLLLLALFVLTLLVASLFLFGEFSDPTIFVRIDVGLLVAAVGTTLCILGAMALWIRGSGERKGQEAKAHAETRAAFERQRFLQRLDHELKNPLMAIRAALVNLTDVPRDLQEREALSTVETQTLRLNHLVATLRKLAELETRPIQRSPVDLTDVLRDVVLLADENPAREGRQLTLTLPQAPWPLPQVSGDYDLLILAVHNLLDNALKFSCSGDTIEVRAFEDGAMLAIQVADTGPGIAEDDVPHVWEELYRGKSAYGVSGSGLGLALVRAIADRHGGHVSLRSREGQGTVVTLRLPIGALPQ